MDLMVLMRPLFLDPKLALQAAQLNLPATSQSIVKLLERLT